MRALLQNQRGRLLFLPAGKVVETTIGALIRTGFWDPLNYIVLIRNPNRVEVIL